ncbi:phage head-tail joining protein [Methylobacterium sp. ID0610]|uniref:phage head-tail joining protein n=1 Tax=Methylobacterium carpenticola TaxID=3344827 RepID=UPI003683D5DE
MADTPEQQLAKLRAQLAKLDQAMASGVLTVEQADNAGRITYRSYAEMKQARADLVRRINDLAATLPGAVVQRRTRQVVMTGRSGW